MTELFAKTLSEALGWETTAPYSGTVYDLLEDRPVRETFGIPVGTRAEPENAGEPFLEARRGEEKQRFRRKKSQDTYRRLLAAAERLLAMARRSDGLANKDMARFADQITSLCDKWE